MKRGAVIALVATAALLAGGGAFWWYFIETYHGYDPLPFTPQSWASSDAEARGHMLDDFLRKHPPSGMAQDEVLRLLGQPDMQETVAELHERLKGQKSAEEMTREWGEPAPGHVSSMSYRVGYRGFNRRAPMVFAYRFDIDLKDGRAIDWGIDD